MRIKIVVGFQHLMRVTLLVDNLTTPETVADLRMLVGTIDSLRIQLSVCALRSTSYPADFTLEAMHALSPHSVAPLVNALRRSEAELIHILEPSAIAIGSLAARLANVPAMASLYGHPPLYSWVGRRLIDQRFHHAILQNMMGIIVPFEHVGQSVHSVYEIPKERIHVVGRAVHLPERFTDYRPDRKALELPERHLAVMIPPETLDDGYESVFEALPRLLKRVPDAHIAVAGSGPQVQAMRKKSQEYPVQPAVLWWGDRFDFWQSLALADVILDTPFDNKIPPTLIAGALLGKAVISSRLPMIEEVVEHNVSGLLVTPNDSTDYATQMMRLMNHEGLAERIGRLAQKRALARFSAPAQRDVLMGLYEEIIYMRR
jgi:glycosyltransferase involved in cell wall biosynthesis